MRSNDKYHCRILTTNIKRWDKISNKYKISPKTDNKYHNLVFALLDIYTSLINSHIDVSNVFSQIELFLLYSDFTSLIRLAIGHNKSGILEKLFNYNPNIYRQIEVMYNDRVKITIADNSQIGNIIALVREKLEDNSEYTIDKHKELVRKELEEREYPIETIEEWLEYIE